MSQKSLERMVTECTGNKTNETRARKLLIEKIN